MSRRTQVVVGSRERSDDDLLLPRPPGVFRRFWARHPVLADVLIVLAALLATLPAVTVTAPGRDAPAAAQIWWAILLGIGGAVALFFRRRAPLVVLAVCAASTLLSPPFLAPIGHLVLGFATYAVAVYRSSRACWSAFGTISGLIAIQSALAAVAGWDTVNAAVGNIVSATVTMLIGALIGVNVGGRRRYTQALIDRSRQLLVERDQQGQLAAAAERTRIAREMHDIVAHALTVVVALSEGAAAATSPTRARVASRGAADTARGALTEMRAMLGVLREEGDERSPLEPLEPVDPAHVVETAQRAGYPVRLETTGARDDLPRPVRFALGRIVQEGVTNAMRHAPAATAVTVRITVTQDEVTVVVRNDGIGPATSARADGFGLRGLRERVELAGGRLGSARQDAATWMLRATLPLSARETEGAT